MDEAGVAGKGTHRDKGQGPLRGVPGEGQADKGYPLGATGRHPRPRLERVVIKETMTLRSTLTTISGGDYDNYDGRRDAITKMVGDDKDLFAQNIGMNQLNNDILSVFTLVDARCQCIEDH